MVSPTSLKEYFKSGRGGEVAETNPTNPTRAVRPPSSGPPPQPVAVSNGGEKQSIDDKCGSGNFLATNLLPKADPKFKEWGELAPKGPMTGADMLLDPVKVIGYDTVSNQLRNASYDLRKEPQCPTQAVSPWVNSTIGPDLMRKPLEDCRSWSLPSTRQH